MHLMSSQKELTPNFKVGDRVLVKYRKRKGTSAQKDTKNYNANIISKSQYGQFQVQFEKSGVQTWVLKRYLEKVPNNEDSENTSKLSSNSNSGNLGPVPSPPASMMKSLSLPGSILETSESLNYTASIHDNQNYVFPELGQLDPQAEEFRPKLCEFRLTTEKRTKNKNNEEEEIETAMNENTNQPKQQQQQHPQQPSPLLGPINSQILPGLPLLPKQHQHSPQEHLLHHPQNVYISPSAVNCKNIVMKSQYPYSHQRKRNLKLQANNHPQFILNANHISNKNAMSKFMKQNPRNCTIHPNVNQNTNTNRSNIGPTNLHVNTNNHNNSPQISHIKTSPRMIPMSLHHQNQQHRVQQTQQQHPQIVNQLRTFSPSSSRPMCRIVTNNPRPNVLTVQQHHNGNRSISPNSGHMNHPVFQQVRQSPPWPVNTQQQQHQLQNTNAIKTPTSINLNQIQIPNKQLVTMNRNNAATNNFTNNARPQQQRPRQQQQLIPRYVPLTPPNNPNMTRRPQQQKNQILYCPRGTVLVPATRQKFLQRKQYYVPTNQIYSSPTPNDFLQQPQIVQTNYSQKSSGSIEKNFENHNNETNF